MKTRLGWLLWCISALVLMGGCASMFRDEIKGAAKKPAPMADEANFIFHRVMSGETMASIARYYSGKEGTWREVAEANPDLNPTSLKTDEIVKVPRSIATLNKEQPAFSTARKRPKKNGKKGSTATDTPAHADDNIEGDDDEPIFGPK